MLTVFLQKSFYHVDFVLKTFHVIISVLRKIVQLKTFVEAMIILFRIL